LKKFLLAFAILCASLWAAPSEVGAGVKESSDDKSLLSFFIQPSISFIGFDSRDKFQAQVDTIYKHYKAQALTKAESSYVAKQDF
jgi:hypothetical protein